MTITFLGFDGCSYTSMFYTTQAHRENNQSSSSNTGGLPSPPPSARSSIDITQSSTIDRREQLHRSNSLQRTVQRLSYMSAPVLLPQTVVGSPPKTNLLIDITTILTQFQPIIDFRENALWAYMIASDQAGTRESLRIDFRPDKLIVRVPSIGHEMIGSLMDKSGSGYPELYGRSRIVVGGCADIHYNSGHKSPDFSLYEVKDGGVSNDQDSSTPTVVFEVAYSQTTRSVVQEAARHICLTRGEVQLVVAIDIAHKTGTRRRELESVTWSHWEVQHRNNPSDRLAGLSQCREDEGDGIEWLGLGLDYPSYPS
ncbi:hypothetical protein PILCRDRAFT_4992 [Piloderma croceum F 1598]|uniref:Restriction endonuclease domain-containing protein n=1 Tax=Piloderma croceum (strain F 1598) TaxID=765440 RepID=A0A0C3C852_PILCF|nr:hypothetical protein PILCRDRAFT_4992 [Piloderma croceum F 1598]